MEEIWKDIKGYEGLYQVSNLGRVKSLNYMKTGKEKILKPVSTPDGYLKVNLYSGKCCTKRIHRLVAEAFIEIPKLEVNHLNGNKEDNTIENLEWCTHPENERYSWNVLDKKSNGKGRGNTKAIIQYDLYGNYIKRWKSATEAGIKLKIRASKISACCRGERNKTGGYKWKFI